MRTFSLCRGKRLIRGLLSTASFLLALLMMSTPAQAAFHLWSIREIYTDSSGTLQFIELFTSDFSQQFVGGQQIISRNVGNTMHNTFTIPSGSNLPGDSANHAFLLGTAGIDSSGGPAPDFVIPNNFLFAGGGTITFFGTPSTVTYSALPTDGLLSRSIPSGANSLNSPLNFAGAGGSVVPEPSTFALFALSGLGVFWMLRRRSRSA